MKHLEKLNLRRLPEGTVLPVKVVPGASRNTVAGVLGDCLKVATSAPAEKGKANAAVTKILADALGVDDPAVHLHSGHGRPRKEFLIAGLTPDQLRGRLGQA